MADEWCREWLRVGMPMRVSHADWHRRLDDAAAALAYRAIEPRIIDALRAAQQEGDNRGG